MLILLAIRWIGGVGIPFSLWSMSFSSSTTTSHNTISCRALFPPHTQLSAALVNDGYCDCWNGQDEPNTAACSHVLVHQAVFDCGDDSTATHTDAIQPKDRKNSPHPGINVQRQPRQQRRRQREQQRQERGDARHESSSAAALHGSSSTWIYASRVGDGVVDCPNGRDEER